MTVGELIDELEKYDPDTVVVHRDDDGYYDQVEEVFSKSLTGLIAQWAQVPDGATVVYLGI
jgi:hypothetical protein